MGVMLRVFLVLAFLVVPMTAFAQGKIGIINLDDARSLSTSLNRRIADWSEISRADSAAARVRPEQIVMRIARAWYENLSALSSQGFDGLPQRYAAVDGLLGQFKAQRVRTLQLGQQEPGARVLGNGGADVKAVISGFNDPTGDAAKNAELSKHRAQAVRAARVLAGVPEDRTTLEKPVEASDTGANNAASRRVDVMVRK